MNSRRTALRTIGLLSFAALAHAQNRDRPVRIGTMTYQPRTANFIVAYEQRLRELGYVDGKNMVMDFRTLERSGGSVIDVARSIVAAEPDVILAPGPSETLEGARAATRTIPIVIIAIDYDPLTAGYVQSLARPGLRRPHPSRNAAEHIHGCLPLTLLFVRNEVGSIAREDATRVAFAGSIHTSSPGTLATIFQRPCAPSFRFSGTYSTNSCVRRISGLITCPRS